MPQTPRVVWRAVPHRPNNRTHTCISSQRSHIKPRVLGRRRGGNARTRRQLAAAEGGSATRARALPAALPRLHAEEGLADAALVATTVIAVPRPRRPGGPVDERQPRQGLRARWRGLTVVDNQAPEYHQECHEIEPVRGGVLHDDGEEEGVHVRGEEGQVEHRRVPGLEEERRPAVHHRQAEGETHIVGFGVAVAAAVMEGTSGGKPACEQYS